MNNHKIDNTVAIQILEITALYKVAFNRLPDPDGLAYWLNDMANGQTLHQVANSFAVHLPQFGTGNINTIINQFSNNAFGHNASVDVLNHWGNMAYMAVPSFALVEQMALQLVGQPIDNWGSPVV